MLRGDRTCSHVTAPGGFPGGIDARLGGPEAEIVFPAGLTEQDARRLLAKAQQGDGIEEITADGSVRMVPACAEIMREIIGYDCDVLHFDEVADRADELVRRLPEGPGGAAHRS